MVASKPSDGPLRAVGGAFHHLRDLRVGLVHQAAHLFCKSFIVGRSLTVTCRQLR